MGDMSMPPDYPTIPISVYDEAKLVKLARQIAMGIKDVPDILSDNGLTVQQFDDVKRMPHFVRLLESEVKAWGAAENTNGRLKIKAAAMLEEYLPEFYARLNDRNEPLMAKIKALELAARIAGFGDRDVAPTGTPGDKVHVVINLGADMRSEYIKVLPHKVIEHEATPAPEDRAMQTFEESLDASSY
jgi:hypothetical protein